MEAEEEEKEVRDNLKDWMRKEVRERLKWVRKGTGKRRSGYRRDDQRGKEEGDGTREERERGDVRRRMVSEERGERETEVGKMGNTRGKEERKRTSRALIGKEVK